MAVLLAHSASHFYPHPSAKTITQPFCQLFARWKRFNYSYLINIGASSSSHQEFEPNLDTRKWQQDSSRKKKRFMTTFELRKHLIADDIPCPRDGSCALRSFSSVDVAFLLASARFCHCQSLKTFSLMPAIFQTPEVTDWLTHFLHLQVCSPDWLRHLLDNLRTDRRTNLAMVLFKMSAKAHVWLDSGKSTSLRETKSRKSPHPFLPKENIWDKKSTRAATTKNNLPCESSACSPLRPRAELAAAWQALAARAVLFWQTTNMA